MKTKLTLKVNEKDVVKKAMLYLREIMPVMEALRQPIDELELLIDSILWPVPRYGSLMLK